MTEERSMTKRTGAEALEVLEMVREGRVTPEQGAELLAALKSRPSLMAAAGGEKPRFLRVRGNVQEDEGAGDKVAVNLNLPIAMADLALKLVEQAKDGYAGMRLAQKYGKPLVVTVHGQDFQQAIFWGKKYRERIEEVMRFSHKTVTVSEKLKRIAEKEIDIAHDKISVVANGIDPEDLFLEKDREPMRLEGHTVLLSVSNLKSIKGLDLNIRAFARLKVRFSDLYYIIIGDGEERETLRGLVKELRLEDRVEFLGELPHREAMEYMSCCDIFSLPSWNEGFGVVYLEAMAYGKPVIGCRGQGIDGTVVHGETGMLAEPKSVESLSCCLEYLLKDRGNRQKIGMNAKKIVLESYTWENSARTLLSLYGSMIEDRRHENREAEEKR